MGSFSIWHFLVTLLILFVVIGIPTMNILRRVGLSRWLSVLAAIPFLNLVFLWVFAFAKWPKVD